MDVKSANNATMQHRLVRDPINIIYKRGFLIVIVYIFLQCVEVVDQTHGIWTWAWLVAYSSFIK